MNVICVGEMLIDFVCTDTNMGLVKGTNYLKKSGGAPANVAACIGNLGGSAVLVGAVGNDPFGEYLNQEVQRYNVNISHVAILPMSTTFAFVSLSDNGEREFAFSRGADEHLYLDHAMIDALNDNSILHLGSATALLGGALGKSYLELAQSAKSKGNIICFDPNFRIDLWRNREDEFRKACLPYFQMADIVKVSDEELSLLSEQQNMEKGCQYFHNMGIKTVLVTLGGDGCFVSHDSQQSHVPAYKIKAVDTTGAGDSFIGAILFKMSQNPYGTQFTKNDIESFVAFAGKVSGLVCSKIGAMSALPTLAEVEAMTFIVKK